MDTSNRDFNVDFKPNGPRIVVKKKENAEEITPGGIALPQSNTMVNRPFQGVVVAVGTGNFYPTEGKRVPPDFQVGDWIYYHTGDDIQIGDQVYVIIMEANVLGSRPSRKQRNAR